MSVRPQPWPQPAPEIVAAVAAMYRGKRERPLPVMVRDQLGEWLADEQFAGAYGKRGKPGWPPGQWAGSAQLASTPDSSPPVTDARSSSSTSATRARAPGSTACPG